MPVHNGADYVAAAIESILGQEFTDFELVISDNASTDATGEICRRYAELDPRVRYERVDTNLGAAANHNRVIRLGRGEYFKLACHDDLCHPRMLGRCVEELRSAPSDVVLVHPRSVFIDAAGEVVGDDHDHLATEADAVHRRLGHVVSHVNMVNAWFGVIRYEALRRTRLIEAFPASDYVVLAELALLGKLREVPETLFYRRLHPAMSRQANRRTRDVLAWFDPGARRRRLALPQGLRLVVEYERSVAGMALSPVSRLLCWLVAPTAHYVRRVRVHAGRARRRLRPPRDGRRRGGAAAGAPEAAAPPLSR